MDKYISFLYVLTLHFVPNHLEKTHNHCPVTAIIEASLRELSRCTYLKDKGNTKCVTGILLEKTLNYTRLFSEVYL